MWRNAAPAAPAAPRTGPASPSPLALPCARATAGVTPVSPSTSLSHKQRGVSGEPRKHRPRCEGGFWGGCSICLPWRPGLWHCPSSWRNQTERKLCLKKKIKGPIAFWGIRRHLLLIPERSVLTKHRENTVGSGRWGESHFFCSYSPAWRRWTCWHSVPGLHICHLFYCHEKWHSQ